MKKLACASGNGNVGVIGIALFNQVGSDPWTNEEVRPGRFATPP
jgi:hypothetical protein